MDQLTCKTFQNLSLSEFHLVDAEILFSPLSPDVTDETDKTWMFFTAAAVVSKLANRWVHWVSVISGLCSIQMPIVTILERGDFV